MQETPGRTVLLLLAVVGAALLLFVMLFDRHVYYDYHDARCAAGAVTLEATLRQPLAGELGEDAPYSLLLEVDDGERFYGLSGVALSSVRSGERIALSEGARTVDMDPAMDTARQVFLKKSLRLSHDDYVVSGRLHSLPPAQRADAAFSCVLKKDYRTEWRSPWMDALMSV